MATLKQLIIQAVRANDPKAADRVVTCMRFRYGMNYREIYEFVHRITGVSMAEWDGLLAQL